MAAPSAAVPSPAGPDPEQGGPLARDTVARIDATVLPALERHHLRVLAHSLATLRSMAGEAAEGPLPDGDQRRDWCSRQEAFRRDPGFLPLFLSQLENAGRQLEDLARGRRTSPLALAIDDLIDDAEERARRRLRSVTSPPD